MKIKKVKLIEDRNYYNNYIFKCLKNEKPPILLRFGEEEIKEDFKNLLNNREQATSWETQGKWNIKLNKPIQDFDSEIQDYIRRLIQEDNILILNIRRNQIKNINKKINEAYKYFKENNKLSFNDDDYWKLMEMLIVGNGRVKNNYFTSPIEDNQKEEYIKDTIYYHTTMNELERKGYSVKDKNFNQQRAKEMANLKYFDTRDNKLNKEYLCWDRRMISWFATHHMMEGYIQDEERYFVIYVSDHQYNTKYYWNLNVHNKKYLCFADHIQHCYSHLISTDLLMEKNKKIAIKDRINLFNQFINFMISYNKNPKDKDKWEGFDKQTRNGIFEDIYYNYDKQTLNNLLEMVNYSYSRLKKYKYRKWG